MKSWNRKSVAIRPATLHDLQPVLQLFQSTVMRINARDYAADQIKTWAASTQFPKNWARRIREQHFIIAEQQDQLLGFASLTKEGYLDLMYVHQDHQGQGIATLLLEVIENTAIELGLTQINSDVSITARPFFEKRGYAVLREQQVEVRGAVFTNYHMTKSLAGWCF